MVNEFDLAGGAWVELGKCGMLCCRDMGKVVYTGARKRRGCMITLVL